MKEINIDPITRLEGHGSVSIFLNDKGEVENAYLKVPELRGFEAFCLGRPAELMPIITTRICGVCPVAHHYASVKALDAAFQVSPPSAAKKLRELQYMGYLIYDHILHFYYLGGPDFIVGPDAPADKRNILGVIEKAGMDVAKEVIKHRAYGQKITEIIGGKATHPVSGLPGGVSKPLSEENRKAILEMARSSVKFAQFTLGLFHQLVLENPKYLDMIKSDAYSMRTYYMGMVDAKNRVNFYDGEVRVVDPTGKEYARFSAADYAKHIEERSEEWTYSKFPFLRKVGWNGLTDGQGSGIYRVGPLGRLNVSEGMATPLAQKEYELLFSTLGKPAHGTLVFHWARLVELLYAAERAVELASDPEITSTKVRNMPGKPGEGVGIVEAARGTLVHHYRLDQDALVRKVNMIVATTNNYPAICMSIRDAAKGVIHDGKVDQGVLNKVEMAFRAYDPCFGCATHFAIGQMPLEVLVYDDKGRLLDRQSR
ncbi:MAG: F420-non-reducing hydrogenase iron-sulfur subunit A [Methanomassiliicoccales archaeon PtaU1.Bin124]|nr:MAG: F420-non-reducing hydrogenase iron-sulfur subunit A [Methanomassiliicoccales archaeon PtaU1.Bin124]